MIEDARAARGSEDGFVGFHAAGDRARGAFRCAECGYGVAIAGALPACPMCAGTSWELELRPPFRPADETVERLERR